MRAGDVTLSQRALAGFFVFAGVMHFVRPRAYEAIVPPASPVPPKEAVAISGAAEIAGGLAVLHPALRRPSRWWLIGVLVAVFPANIHMAVSPGDVKGLPDIPRWLLWARLPLQPLMMLWVWRATDDGPVPEDG